MTSTDIEHDGNEPSARDQLALVQSSDSKAIDPKQTASVRPVVDSAVIAIVSYSEAMNFKHEGLPVRPAWSGPSADVPPHVASL